MNEQNQPSVFDRSPLVHFFRWLFTWRGLRRLLIVLAWTATLIALLYGEENWRGSRAWNKYRRELEARGEQLDLKAFIPKPVPDEQNFAATPFAESWFVRPTNNDQLKQPQGDNYSRASEHVSSSKAKQARGRAALQSIGEAPASSSQARRDEGGRQCLDLVAWEMAFTATQPGKPVDSAQKFESDRLDLASRSNAAPAVLEGLKDYEAHFVELRAASQRLYSRYPVKYDLDNPWGILLPHLAKLKGACLRLQLKICAELAVGQSEAALQDVKLLLYLTDSVKDEPFLISYLVRIACLHIAIQPIWEGLAEHRWSEAQLQALQTRLQQYDFVADVKQSLEAERAAGILTGDLLARGKYHLEELSDSSANECDLADLLGRIMPRGWYQQEKLTYCRLFHVALGTGLDTTKKRISPSQVESAACEFERAISGSAGNGWGSSLSRIIHHRTLAVMLLPALSKVTRKSAMAQTATGEAALACALERYRLANGQFPEKLEALMPRFISALPNDALTGEPYKYRRTEDGQFVLYSVGWDEKDDGGISGHTLFDEKRGDWVWRYSAK